MKNLNYYFLIILLIVACKKDHQSLSASIQEIGVFQEAQPTDICFIDEKIGFISSSIEPNLGSASIATTIDAGISWKIFPVIVDNEPTSIIRSVSAKSIKDIYATFNTKNNFCGICKSLDGGISWKSIFKTNIIQPYTGLLVREKNIFVCRGNGDILKSIDDGISWKIVYKYENFFGGIGNPFFTSDNIGFAYGGYVGDGGSNATNSFGTLLKTTDAGETWIELHSISEFITSLTFKNDNEGYAFTFNNKVYKTVDGGSNWTKIKDLSGGYFASVLINNNIYYANGGSNLYQSDTNFENIKQIYSSVIGTNYYLKSIKTSENSALFLSDRQSLLKLTIK